MPTNPAKAAAGKAAAALVQSGMVVGLGTGSTAFFFVQELIQRRAEGLDFTTVPTSESSRILAQEGGIPFADLSTLTAIDLTVDGADEIDSRGRLLKGGGGALLREKIVANISKKYVIIADTTKQVDYLGRFPLAIELTPFCHHATIHRIEQLGYRGKLRMNGEKPFTTDNGNLIFDIALAYPCENPEEDHRRIRAVIGVVETGFFFNPVSLFLIGQPDGSVEELTNRNRGT